MLVSLLWAWLIARLWPCPPRFRVTLTGSLGTPVVTIGLSHAGTSIAWCEHGFARPRAVWAGLDAARDTLQSATHPAHLCLARAGRDM